MHHDLSFLLLYIGAAVGKPVRVPYLKRHFRVEGLPEGVVFKQPFSYGRNQIQLIMTKLSSVLLPWMKTVLMRMEMRIQMRAVLIS